MASNADLPLATEMWKASLQGDLSSVDEIIVRHHQHGSRSAGSAPPYAAQRGIDGMDALMLAACGGHAPVLKMLLAQGVSVDVRDRSGMNALDHAQVAF